MDINVVRINHCGGPEVMTLERQHLPPPLPNEVQLKISAIGLNMIDTYHRSGLYPLALPSGLGCEAAGEVVAVGVNVSRFKIGDRAAFSMGIGAYAEAMNLLEMQLVPIPDGVSDAQAASVLLKGMTVEFLFHHTYPLHGGETILFHAAAGGVGLLACQWARDIGVHLIGTASTQEKCDLAMQNGAAASFISDDPQLPALLREASGGEGFPVVYDSVGKASFQTSLEALKPFGMFVSFGNASGPVDPIAPSLLAAHGSLYFTRPTLATYVADITRMQVSAQKVFDKVVTGKLSVQINQTYALSDIQQAHRDLEARKTTGCSVIIP